MTQYAMPTIDPTIHTGTDLANFLNASYPALYSQHRGSSRPGYALPGMIWIDSSVAGTDSVRYYDGTNDILLYSFNTTTGEVVAGGPFTPGVMINRGSIDPTIAAPASPRNGDQYFVGTAGTAHATFTGLSGTAMTVGDLIYYNGASWQAIRLQSIVGNYLPLAGGTLTGNVAFSGASVSQPFTSVLPANNGGRIGVQHSTNGGFQIQGASASAIAFLLTAYSGLPNALSTTQGVVALNAVKHDGSGGVASLANSENAFSISNNGAVRFLIKGSGSTLISGGLTVADGQFTSLGGDAEIAGALSVGETIVADLQGDVDGTATTALTANALSTPRTLTIGNTGKAFDGSADVTWSLAEIGVSMAWGDITAKPTTVAGFGITDAVTLAGAQTIAGTKTFSSAPIVPTVTRIPSNSYSSYAASTSYVSRLFSTQATTGVLDWNDDSNTMPGAGYTLLQGTATNGPGGPYYYHPFNIHFGVGGNQTQFAIGYNAKDLLLRYRYTGAWTSWSRFLTDQNSGLLGLVNGTSSVTIPTANNEIVATTAGVERLRITAAGAIATGGETAPDVAAGGVSILTGAAGFSLSLKNSAVAHPGTNAAEADTYASFSYINTFGGLDVSGYAATNRAIRFRGRSSAPSTTDTVAGVTHFDSIKNTAAADAALADNENLATFGNNAAVKLTIKGNGDVRGQGGLTLGGAAAGGSLVDPNALKIRHSGGGNPSLITAVSDSFVSPWTAYPSNQMWGLMVPSASAGGFFVNAVSTLADVPPLAFFGVGVGSLDQPAMAWNAAKHDGAGGIVDLADNEILLRVSNGLAKLLLKGNGDMTIAGGLQLSNGTAKLSHYEEGAWTPTLVGSTAGAHSSSVAVGSYSRVGNTVTCHFNLEGTVTTAYLGELSINGLPITVNGPANIKYQMVSGWHESLSSGGAGPPSGPGMHGVALNGETRIRLIYDAGTSTTYLTQTATGTLMNLVGTNFIISGTITYQV